MSGPLYDRANGLISAEGMALLAGLEKSTFLSQPVVNGAMVLPDVWERRMKNTVERVTAERKACGLPTDLYDVLDWLVEERGGAA